MRIFVLGNASRPGVEEEASALLPFLKAHSEVVAFDLRQEIELSNISADMALVLGGDGAILRAARQLGYRQVPVLGVNLGKLGFLADLSPDEVRACFERVVAGDYRVTQHLMFECVVESSSQRSQTLLGLNEVVIHAGPPFHMIDLDLEVDGEAVSRFGGDGLIVSTPIGSTAHNLSAGGPILGQELDTFVITPICPHMLANRPFVDSAAKEYRVWVRRATPGLALIVDGQELMPLAEGDRVVVRRAPPRFQLVKVAGHGYFQALRDKLRWGAPPNYRLGE